MRRSRVRPTTTIYDPLMARLGRRLSTLTLALGVPLLVAGPSYAGGGGFQQCLDQAVDHNGEPPVCTKENGQWVASWPGDNAGSGIPAGFVFLMVIGVVVGLAFLFWKITTAQKLARQSGMDPALATQMTLLSDDGLAATYLASNLRRPASDPVAATAPSPTAASTTATARLEELRDLLDRDLVTQAEYDERRKAIIDSV